jgi:hypothetical protein
MAICVNDTKFPGTTINASAGTLNTGARPTQE